MEENEVIENDGLDEMFGATSETTFENEEQASQSEGKEDTSAAQDASGSETTNEESAESPEKEEAPVLSEEDILKALDPVESPEEKAARLERDYSASSKEAQRLVSERKAVEKVLTEQGLKLQVKDGKVALFPTEKYSADGKSFEAKVDLRDLRGSDLDAMESGDIEEQQKVIDKLVSQVADDARSKLAHAKPTHEKEPAHLSQERLDSVFTSLAETKDVYNQDKHPALAENRKVIEAYINNSARPQVLREAFAEAPEIMAELVNSHINAVRANLTKGVEAAKSAKEKKAQEARQRAERGVSDEGTVTVKGGTNTYLDAMFNKG